MNGEPDLTATFKGGPNDGKGIPIHGSPSAIVHAAGAHGRYELDLIIWEQSGNAIYNWHAEEEA